MNKLTLIIATVVICLALIVQPVLTADSTSKTYDEQTKTATIKDSITGTTVATVQLKSDLVVKVFPGKDRKVAEFVLDHYDNTYPDALSKIDLTDMKTGNTLSRTMNYKYQKIVTADVPNSYQSCSLKYDRLTDKNVTTCESIPNGTVKGSKITWVDFSSLSELPAGAVTIGIFTTVEPGDYVEWVPTFFGSKIPEWAVWSDALNTNIVAYWTLNESTGTFLDGVNGIYNGTWSAGSGIRGVSAKIDKGVSFLGSNYITTASALSACTDKICSVSMWANFTATGNKFFFSDNGNTATLANIFLIGKDSSKFIVQLRNNAGSIFTAYSAVGLNTGALQHVVITLNGSTATMYINGAYDNNLTYTGTYTTNNPATFFGGRAEGPTDIWADSLDEVGVWNEVLSAQLVSDLYNSGTGITYLKNTTVIPPAADDINVYLDTPFNNTGVGTSAVNFTGNQSTAGNATHRNATLFVWTGNTVTYSTMNTVTGNGTNVTSFLNIPLADGTYRWNIFGCGANFTISMCKWGTQNRTVTVDTVAPTIQINAPNGTQPYYYSNITLNWSVTGNPQSCWFNYNNTNYTLSCITNASSFAVHPNRYNLTFYANDSVGNLRSAYTWWEYILTKNSETYNASTYETSPESYTLNLTVLNSTYTPSSINLIFGGTSYGATFSTVGGNIIARRNLQLPAITNANHSFYWQVNLPTTSSVNTLTSYQYASNLSFIICGGAYTTPFLNISFVNETTAREPVTASVAEGIFRYSLGDLSTSSKTYNYVSAAENPSYSFCAIPTNRPLNADVRVVYDNLESEARTFDVNNLLFTNGTYNQSLYLLPTGGGIYVTFEVLNLAGYPINGAELIAYRSGYGTVETQTTGASGTATIFMNPSLQYGLNVSASGYSPLSIIQTFTLTEYTITLGGSTSGSSIPDLFRGVSYEVKPIVGNSLMNNTDYNFNLSLISTYYSLDRWGFTMYNSTNDVVGGNSSTVGSGGFLSAIVNTGGLNNTLMKMEYYWIYNGTSINKTAYWSINDGQTGSITGFFARLRTYIGRGIYGINLFSFGLLAFLAIMIVAGILSYKYGFTSPAAIIGVMTAVVAIMEYARLLPVVVVRYSITSLLLVILIVSIIGGRE